MCVLRHPPKRKWMTVSSDYSHFLMAHCLLLHPDLLPDLVNEVLRLCDEAQLFVIQRINHFAYERLRAHINARLSFNLTVLPAAHLPSGDLFAWTGFYSRGSGSKRGRVHVHFYGPPLIPPVEDTTLNNCHCSESYRQTRRIRGPPFFGLLRDEIPKPLLPVGVVCTKYHIEFEARIKRQIPFRQFYEYRFVGAPALKLPFYAFQEDAGGHEGFIDELRRMLILVRRGGGDFVVPV